MRLLLTFVIRRLIFWLSKEPDVDWKKLLTELLATGMTQSAIGDEIGVSQGTISHLLNGRIATVEWERGEKLIELHRTRVLEAQNAA